MKDMIQSSMAPARGATTMTRLRRLGKPYHGSRSPIYRGTRACPCHGSSACLFALKQFIASLSDCLGHRHSAPGGLSRQRKWRWGFPLQSQSSCYVDEECQHTYGLEDVDEYIARQ